MQWSLNLQNIGNLAVQTSGRTEEIMCHLTDMHAQVSAALRQGTEAQEKIAQITHEIHALQGWISEIGPVWEKIAKKVTEIEQTTNARFEPLQSHLGAWTQRIESLENTSHAFEGDITRKIESLQSACHALEGNVAQRIGNLESQVAQGFRQVAQVQSKPTDVEHLAEKWEIEEIRNALHTLEEKCRVWEAQPWEGEMEEDQTSVTGGMGLPAGGNTPPTTTPASSSNAQPQCSMPPASLSDRFRPPPLHSARTRNSNGEGSERSEIGSEASPCRLRKPQRGYSMALGVPVGALGAPSEPGSATADPAARVAPVQAAPSNANSWFMVNPLLAETLKVYPKTRFSGKREEFPNWQVKWEDFLRLICQLTPAEPSSFTIFTLMRE